MCTWEQRFVSDQLLVLSEANSAERTLNQEHNMVSYCECDCGVFL